MKKKILLISDVRGWGGWERGLTIQKHFSDEFDIDIIDQMEFRDSLEGYIYFNFTDVKQFQDKVGKTRVNIDRFSDWIKTGKGKKYHFGGYDLYYFLFHIIVMSKEGEQILNQKDKKTLVACTGYPIIRDHFPKKASDWLKLSTGLSANNMLSFEQAKKLNKNVFYIPRGVDPELFYPTTPYINDREFTVVFVGKKGSGKGCNTFIRPACEAVGAKLLINDRNYTNALPKDSMRELYNQAHVYVVASETDGTPNPALEAAACARPIISNRIGNMPEFIQHAHNGFLIGRKLEQITNRLRWIKNNPLESEQMGINARQTILDGWTWEHSMEYERKAINKVLSI